MTLELHAEGTLISSITRAAGRNFYAFTPDGGAVGQFADFDAAARSLLRLQQLAT